MPQLGRSVATRAEISGAIYASFDFHAGRHIDLTDSLASSSSCRSCAQRRHLHDVVDIDDDRFGPSTRTMMMRSAARNSWRIT